MRQRNATSPARINAAARQREAFALRLAGKTYREIGELLDMSGPHAFRLVTAEIERTAAEAREEIDAMRALEMARLDAMQAAIWPAALAGDLSALDRFLRISARRAALLGLDRPAQAAWQSGPPLPAGWADAMAGILKI